MALSLSNPIDLAWLVHRSIQNSHMDLRSYQSMPFELQYTRRDCILGEIQWNCTRIVLYYLRHPFSCIVIAYVAQLSEFNV